jgi:hypothetical protein
MLRRCRAVFSGTHIDTGGRGQPHKRTGRLVDLRVYHLSVLVNDSEQEPRGRVRNHFAVACCGRRRVGVSTAGEMGCGRTFDAHVFAITSHHRSGSCGGCSGKCGVDRSTHTKQTIATLMTHHKKK